MADCDACGSPQPDVAFVCARCERTLADRLNHAAGLWPDLLVAAAGQARMTDPGPRARGMAPAEPVRPDAGALRHYADQVTGPPAGLPFRWNAAEIRDDVRNTVSTWCRVVLDERSPAPAQVRVLTGIRDLARWDGPPADTPGMMRWLAGQLGWCRYQRWADEMWDHLGDELRRIEPAVDRPPPRLDAGPCLSPTPAGPCRQRLSAPPRAAVVHCPVCRAVHSATDRSETILAAARDALLTAEESAHLLSLHGYDTPSATVRRWIARRQLQQAGTAGGQATYPFGRVMQLRTELWGRRGSCRSAA
jgi:hypothetical protein